MFLDGILGTGIKLPVKPDLAQVMAFIREAVSKVEDGHVVAVDCPSGVDCDTGEAPPECIPAELTVTMAAIKQGLLHFPAYQLAGRIELVGIGLGEGHAVPESLGGNSPCSPRCRDGERRPSRAPFERAQGDIWHGSHCCRLH